MQNALKWGLVNKVKDLGMGARAEPSTASLLQGEYSDAHCNIEFSKERSIRRRPTERHASR